MKKLLHTEINQLQEITAEHTKSLAMLFEILKQYKEDNTNLRSRVADLEARVRHLFDEIDELTTGKRIIIQ